MLSQVFKKMLFMIPILLLVSIILFIIINILPGDAAIAIAGEAATEENIKMLREELGLNQPLIYRYFNWLKGVLRGDFGKSVRTKQPVIEIIAQRLPVTIELTLLAITISTIVAVPLGIYAAIKRNSFVDIINGIVAMIGAAMPNFWLGLLLLLTFSLKFRLLPASGYIPFTQDPLGNIRCLILPSLTIGIPFAATVMRQTRSSMLEVLGQDYVMTARAKGLKENIVIWKHALRNAVIPVITVISMHIGRMIGGAVVTETIFVIPGLGRELVDGIFTRNYPVVMALIMVTAFFVVLSNTLLDVIYAIIDPRISHPNK